HAQRHCRAGAERAEEELVWRGADVGAANVHRLIGGERVCARAHVRAISRAANARGDPRAVVLTGGLTHPIPSAARSKYNLPRVVDHRSRRAQGADCRAHTVARGGSPCDSCSLGRALGLYGIGFRAHALEQLAIPSLRVAEALLESHASPDDAE